MTDATFGATWASISNISISGTVQIQITLMDACMEWPCAKKRT